MTQRILHIIPTLDRSGAEKQLSLLARGLPRDRFDVHVCALTRGGPLEAELRAAGVPTTVIGKRWRIDPAAWWRLARHVRRLRPAIVQTWLFAADAYGRLAGIAAGARLIGSLRCVDPWKGWVEGTVDRLLARRTERLVANSPGVREFYIGRGLPAEKIEVIVNGVEPPRVSRLSRAEVLGGLGAAANARLVGLVGRLAAQKRVKDAIWAADLLKVVRGDVHLLVIGDGPLADRLQLFRDQVRIADRVHFLGHRADVADLLPHFDLLWSTSGFEGQSNSILEAMAAGVPVVASDIPGTRDLVLPGETGLLFPRGDRAGLAQRTYQLLEDEPRRRRLGENAARRAAEEFRVEAMVARYAALYESLA